MNLNDVEKIQTLEALKEVEEVARGFRQHLIDHDWPTEVAIGISASLLNRMLEW